MGGSFPPEYTLHELLKSRLHGLSCTVAGIPACNAREHSGPDCLDFPVFSKPIVVVATVKKLSHVYIQEGISSDTVTQ